ncbi:MAG TPA: winged helix-turn-helix domain-containing protein [Solirubrobacterales bacterium]|nr:winged helix-turn-helix domain-containing protein [Solirubrobacterales bacterium]
MAAEAVERHSDKLKRKRGRKTRKRIEEAVQYALSHDIRLEILILLNEASYTASEVAELTEIELKKVSNHLLRMLEDGSIEVAKKEERRGTMIYWYRAVEVPEYTQEEAERLTEMELQLIAGVVAQSGTAELMAALNKGTLASPRTILSWDLYDVDGQAREDIEAESARYLERLKEIQCESVNRVAESKEETTSMIVSLSAFKRARKIRVPRSRSCDPPPQTD